MSMLISSAVAGKQSAPKGPARRRAAPPPPIPPTPEEKHSPAPPASTSPPPPVPSVEKDATDHVPTAPPPPPLPPTLLSPPVILAYPPPLSQQEARPATLSPLPIPVEIRPPSAASPTEPEASHSARPPWTPSAKPLVGGSGKRKSADTAAPHPAKKRQKRGSARSDALVQRTEGEEGVTNDREATSTKQGRSKKLRATAKSKRTTTNDNDADSNDGEVSARPAPPPRRRRPLKPRSPPRSHPTSDAEGDDEDDEDEKNRRKLARETALESHEHDADETSMWEISRDSRHGRVSQLERDMRKIDWVAVRRKQREEAEAVVVNARAGARGGTVDEETAPVVETTEGHDGEGGAVQIQPQQEQQHEGDEEAVGEAEDGPPPTSQPTSGPQYKLINNEIVLDEPTLTLPAPRLPSPTTAGTVNEETDLTRVLNRNTHINARRRHPADRLPPGRKRARGGWSEEDTERFYEAVEIWGMDWEMVARLFQGKDRGMCKRKWEMEGKVDPERVEGVWRRQRERGAAAAAAAAAARVVAVPAAGPGEPEGGDVVISPITATSMTATETAPSMSLTAYAAHTGLPASTYAKYRDMAHFLSVMRDDMQEEETRMRTERAEEEGHRRAAEEQAKGKEEAKRKAAESRRAGGGKKGGKRNWRMGDGWGTLGGG